MNILFVSTWFPYPLDNGSRLRVYHLLNALVEKHNVHLASFVPPSSNFSENNLQDFHLDKVVTVNHDPFHRDKRKKYLAHFSLTPRDVILSYSVEMESVLQKLHSENRYDAIIASVLNTSPYVKNLHGTPLLLEEHNFTTQWLEERFHKSKSVLKKLSTWISWQKCRRYEANLYQHFHAVTMVSDDDKRAVEKAAPGFKGILEVIPNGVDLKTRKYNTDYPEPGTLIFNGSLTYAVNEDAMKFFIMDIWPRIQKSFPGTQLKITGRLKGVDTGWIPVNRNIILTGYLENVVPAVARSWACVVPLRDGSGTRLKILEAMAIGTPVVSTSKGAEGINAEHGKHLLIADDPESFAVACVRLMKDPSLRSSLSRQARNLVEEQYGWEQIGMKFTQLVEKLT